MKATALGVVMITGPLTIGILISMLAVAPTNGQARGPLTKQEATLILRALNTAQADAFRTTNAYAELSTLVKSEMFDAPPFDQLRRISTQSVNAAVPVGSHTLSVLITPGKDQYAMSLLSSENCSPAWFTSTTGVIYEGRALGCGQ